MIAATDYHVINSAEVTVYTSPDFGLAKREAARRTLLGETVEVHEVTVSVTRRRVYKPRAPREQAVAA